MNLLAITEMVSRSKLTLWQIHSLQLIKGDLPAQFTQKMLIINFFSNFKGNFEQIQIMRSVFL